MALGRGHPVMGGTNVGLANSSHNREINPTYEKWTEIVNWQVRDLPRIRRQSRHTLGFRSPTANALERAGFADIAGRGGATRHAPCRHPASGGRHRGEADALPIAGNHPPLMRSGRVVPYWTICRTSTLPIAENRQARAGRHLLLLGTAVQPQAE